MTFLAATIAEQLPEVLQERLLREPAARNTAPACALVAFLLEKRAPATVLGVFSIRCMSSATPSDSAWLLRAGVQVASSGPRMVVIGVPPTRPETGYGYIELGAASKPVQVGPECISLWRVRRFTEKTGSPEGPALRPRRRTMSGTAECFCGVRRLWPGPSGEHKPEMAKLLEEIAAAWETPAFEETFARLYPECESVSIDYAVLEPRVG